MAEPRTAADKKERRLRELVTPEGVTLHLRLASAGSRAGAFTVDAVIMLVILIALTVLAFFIIGGFRTIGPAAIIWLLGFFLLRNFYFTLFESGVRAATPGKRMLKLRVVARDGGRLTGGAILARNLMREVEVFLPLIFLLSAQAQGFSNRWLALLGFAWTGIFLFMPLFNRDRLRAGDLIAGTWVVENERPKIAPDLLAANDSARTDAWGFTPHELETYGQFEIQRLEDVLHRNDPDTVTTVAGVIRRKIGRRDQGGSWSEDRAFLEAYYTAARLHLERRLLFGQRKRDKFDSTG
ncbi:RDD family protein [Sphingomonas sp. BT-65]|uniref:RDD family protein n=1 Tax=Sphingomonas sp. BT-65 TaxID=2989821 RepID=UPI0022365EC7|nr:RDD family protein [Sphingomonas sp. BT-65]MCW4460088.1 RDD family protein [Sphingomonas sp. BT-65]